MSDRDVDQFFDAHATSYGDGSGGMSGFHKRTASVIEAGLSGDVLCVGGVWAEHSPLEHVCNSVTVVDVSQAMLERHHDTGADLVVADARDLPFDKARFDHMVLPLVLHHINDGTASGARRAIDDVLREAHRVLQPGGTVWISDFTMRRPVYWAQLAAAPLTRRALSRFQIPLVVMHHHRFYLRALQAAGFEQPTFDLVQARTERLTDWIAPVIGLPHLKIPRALYPVRPVLIRGQRRSTPDT